MTNYSAWDSKASALAREADEDEKQEKEANDKALGLEGGPKGPPTAKAEKEMKELGAHSEKRKEFIDWSKSREVPQTHKAQDEPIVLEGEEVKTKALKLIGSEGVTYIVPEEAGLIKLSLEKCKNVKLQILSTILTSSVEVFRCADITFDLAVPVGTFQVDECTKPVIVNFAEKDHVGHLYHQNSPGLSVSFGNEVHSVGKNEQVQYYTRLGSTTDQPLITNVVRRGEGDFPLDLPGDAKSGGGYSRGDQPEPEAPPAEEERKQKAALKRQSGNEMFRASDFLQAAMEYTAALELDPTMSALYANRAQCWLKLGNHDNALEDSIKTTEVDPSNAKGWFRKGMSLHSMKRYPEAIPAFLEAEKLDPSNKQIQEAIKMAQLMARRNA